jgi:23S rRNA (guanosine2251-2'-O)-methyltransferase
VKQLSLAQLNRLDPESFKAAKKMSVVLVLDNIRSLHNIGSVFRTADAFRVSEVFLCGITACPPHREIHKTALGATDTVSWRYFETTEEALRQLKSDDYKIYAVEQTNRSKLLDDVRYLNIKTALVFGNEVEGVSESALSLCDDAIEIPQAGTKHSLNISVCAGIVMWHFFTEWKKIGNF